MILLAALLLAAPQAGGAMNPDAKCIVVLGAVGAQGNAQQQDMSRRGIMFYLGKLRGRDPSVDVGALVARTAKQATAAKMNGQAEANRCAAELNAAGRSLAAGARAAAPAKPARR